MYYNWQLSERFRQFLEHAVAEREAWDRFDEFQKAAGVVVESTEGHVLDAGLREPHERLDGGGCERGVDDDRQRRELSPNLLERLHFDRTRGAGIGDDEISDEVLHSGVKLTPGEYRGEGVLRT